MDSHGRFHFGCALLAIAGLTSCTTSGSDVAAPDATPVSQSLPNAELEPTPTTTVQATLLPPPNIQLELAYVADLPTDLVSRANDDRIYVAERAGRVAVFEPGTTESVATLVDFSIEVGSERDQAFMSLTFDEEGDTLYVHFSRSSDGASVLRRYRLDGDRVVGTEDLLVVQQPFPDHNGGSIRFGPDGYLYWALGDGGADVDALTTAQDPTNLLGSILRLDVGGESGFITPADNPMVGKPGRDEVWSWGLRNPWRISFDPATGNLWIADVGLLTADEINMATSSTDFGRGVNYGWPHLEGTTGEASIPVVNPVLEYDQAEGRCSISGGEVYRGTAIPDLVGEYLLADFCSGEVFGYRPGDSPRFTVYDPSVATPVGFGVDHNGEVYVISIAGEISRLIAFGS